MTFCQEAIKSSLTSEAEFTTSASEHLSPRIILNRISSIIAAVTIEDNEAFVIDLLRAKKLLVTHGTGFNWPQPDHFRLVTLPDVAMLEEAIGRIADYLATRR